MKLSDNLKNRLSARSQIRTAHSQIKSAQQTIIMSNNESNSWESFKAGKAVFMSSTLAKATIALAAEEVNQLSAGKPASAKPTTPEGKIWANEKIGVHQLFYKNEVAQGVLKIAAAEVAQLKGVQATAAPAAPAPVAAAKPAVSVARTIASKPAPVAPAAGGNGVFAPTIRATLSKQSFDELTATDKMRFVKEGGKIVENEEPTPHSIGGILTRAGLAAMNPTERMAHFKSGGKLTD